MKPLLTFSVLLLISTFLIGQAGDQSLQRQVDVLTNRLKKLEKDNSYQISENRTFDSTIYCAIRSEIFEACSNLPQLDFDYKNTSDKIAVTGLFTKLMQANNPTSDILGFRFSEIIITAAKKHFKEGLKNDQDKKRFSQIIGKIINNPIVSTLANSNPLTSVISSIINTIAGFTTSRLELKKEGGKVRDVAVSQQDAFNNQSIAAFRNELQAYIDFYDALIIASSEYLEGLNNLNVKYAYLIRSVRDFKAELYAGLNVEENKLLISLSKILPDPSVENINYRQLTYDPDIQKIRNLARKYPFLQQDVCTFQNEYNTLLINYLSVNIQTLRLAESFPDKDIDKSKTKALITEIESFIHDQVTIP